MREIDQTVLESKVNKLLLERLILDNEGFIMNCASKMSKRYVSKQDDAWAVALEGFYHAIDKYEYDRGSFYAFAELVIQRRLIDYFRNVGKHHNEIPLEEIEDMADGKDNLYDLKYEVDAITEVLKTYGIHFMELSDSSPKATKTKVACAKVVNYLLGNEHLLRDVFECRQLPIKKIENNVKIPPKIMERHRKYIIAAIEILHGDFPHLGEYLRYIREEAKK